VNWDIGWADIALLGVVTILTTCIAYVRKPRVKSLIYMLPIVFSTATVSTGRGVDASHIVGMTGCWFFLWVVWYLSVRRGIHIVVADIAAIAFYGLYCAVLLPLMPRDGAAEQWWFWGAVLFNWVFMGWIFWRIPPQSEPGHRCTMPAYMKMPLTAGLVSLLVLLKVPLRGFMPAFPLLTIFTVYEARHSLHTLSRRFPVFLVAFTAMAVVMRNLLPPGGSLHLADYLPALAAGWAVYLPIYAAMDWLDGRRMKSHENKLASGVACSHCGNQ
jgi:hypothetical protein